MHQLSILVALKSFRLGDASPDYVGLLPLNHPRHLSTLLSGFDLFLLLLSFIPMISWNAAVPSQRRAARIPCAPSPLFLKHTWLRDKGKAWYWQLALYHRNALTITHIAQVAGRSLQIKVSHFGKPLLSMVLHHGIDSELSCISVRKGTQRVQISKLEVEIMYKRQSIYSKDSQVRGGGRKGVGWSSIAPTNVKCWVDASHPVVGLHAKCSIPSRHPLIFVKKSLPSGGTSPARRMPASSIMNC